MFLRRNYVFVPKWDVWWHFILQTWHITYFIKMILLHCFIEDMKANNVSKIQHNIEVCCLYNPDLASSCVCLHLQAMTGQKVIFFTLVRLSQVKHSPLYFSYSHGVSALWSMPIFRAGRVPFPLLCLPFANSDLFTVALLCLQPGHISPWTQHKSACSE